MKHYFTADTITRAGGDGDALDGERARVGRHEEDGEAGQRGAGAHGSCLPVADFTQEWWVKGEGKAMELGKVLAPLNEFRDKMVFIRGLYNKEA